MARLHIDVLPSSTGVAARLHADDDSLDATIRVDCQSAPLVAEPDVFLAPGLLIGMATGHAVEIAAADPVALEGARGAATLLQGWFPAHLSPVRVHAGPSAPHRAEPATGVGCFFSCGVDSFYSAMKHRDEITHLVFVHGFDISLDQLQLREAASRAAREAAAGLGKPLIEVTTDVRATSDRLLDWGEHFHGAAMAMVAHSLRGLLGKVIVPASYQRRDVFPWGSHPELDPLWSSRRLEMVHDGTEASRPAKAAAIAGSRVAMDHLRVCWENPDQQYNCGTCEKCVRTMINLRAVGALGRCRTLPAHFDPALLRGLTMNRGARRMARENLQSLRAAGVRDARLRRALRARLWAGRRDAARAWLEDRRHRGRARLS